MFCVEARRAHTYVHVYYIVTNDLILLLLLLLLRLSFNFSRLVGRCPEIVNLFSVFTWHNYYYTYYLDVRCFYPRSNTFSKHPANFRFSTFFV